MREFTFISSRRAAAPVFAALLAAAACIALAPRAARADDMMGPGPAPTQKPDKTLIPEEDDFSETPYTEYGEFNEEDDEQETTNFLQHGRLFGVSLGVGFEDVTGNRGALWQGGIPLVDFKFHYWFDFNTALDLDVSVVPHYYYSTAISGGAASVTMIHLGVDLRYYFDTKNLPAAITFSNPFVLIGVGSFTKMDYTFTGSTVTPDSAVGLSAGGGLQFPVKVRKLYLEIEGKVNLANFQDTLSTKFEASNGLADLTGLFLTLSANVLFTF